MEKEEKKKYQFMFVVIAYIMVVGINIWYGFTAYNEFASGVYSDKAFSKGIIGVLLSTCGNIVCVIIATILLIVFVRNRFKKNAVTKRADKDLNENS